jgi:hypothetical protein
MSPEDRKRENDAFRKIDNYLKEQAEALAERENASVCYPQCVLGREIKRQPIARPTRVRKY